MGSDRCRVDMPQLLGFWRQVRLHLDHLIAGTLRLEEINQGFARPKTGEVVRQPIAF
jgi:Zn-dependent alcohol dehydrogenase